LLLWLAQIPIFKKPILYLCLIAETCHNLAPLTSTAMHVALGDALAVCLLELHGFTSRDFAEYHPGSVLASNYTSKYPYYKHITSRGWT
jgi:arabinose-5-phosphate isomerase